MKKVLIKDPSDAHTLMSFLNYLLDGYAIIYIDVPHGVVFDCIIMSTRFMDLYTEDELRTMRKELCTPTGTVIAVSSVEGMLTDLKVTRISDIQVPKDTFLNFGEPKAADIFSRLWNEQSIKWEKRTA